MTTLFFTISPLTKDVVEAYRLDRYDNVVSVTVTVFSTVVEAYRLDRYDNFSCSCHPQ